MRCISSKNRWCTGSKLRHHQTRRARRNACKRCREGSARFPPSYTHEHQQHCRYSHLHFLFIFFLLCRELPSATKGWQATSSIKHLRWHASTAIDQADGRCQTKLSLVCCVVGRFQPCVVESSTCLREVGRAGLKTRPEAALRMRTKCGNACFGVRCWFGCALSGTCMPCP